MISWFNFIKSRFNLPLLGLIITVIAINLPMLFAFYIPLLDTSHSFRVFYIFYNDIYTQGSIPQWLPHVVMGSSSTSYLDHISPPGSLAMALGLIFRVQNAYTLYVTSLIGEQLIFLAGMYLLCKLHFKRDDTVFFVCMSAICGIVIHHQVMLNFRTYYLVPLVFYLLVRFVTEQRWMFLISAAIVFLFFFSGMPGYVVPVMLLVCAVFFITYAIVQRMPLRGYLRGQQRDALMSLTLFAVFLTLLYSYYHYLANMMNNRALMSFGRNPEDFTVSLESFLVYGGHTSPWKFLDFLYPSHLILVDGYSLESTNFIGVLAIPFAVYGLLWGNKPFFRALSATAIVIALFSIGSATPVASALYAFFPFMKTFRHVGFVSCYLNFMLALLAGFGIERFLNRAELESEDKKRTISKIFIAIVLAVILYEFLMYYYFFILSWRQPPPLVMTITGLIVLTVVTASGALVWRKRAPYALAAMLVLGISTETLLYHAYAAWSYMHMVIDQYKEHFDFFGYNDEAVRVNKYSYQATRTMEPPHGRHDYAFGFFGPTGSTFSDDLAYLQWDACAIKFRMDVINVHVKNLIDIILKDGKVENIEDFRKIIACEYPKLRVVENVVFARSAEQTEAIIKNSGNLGEVPVVRSVAGTYTPDTEEDENSDVETGDIPPANSPADDNELTNISLKYNNSARVTDFSANHVVAEAYTDNPDGAWLYYADAWNPHWRATVNGEATEIFRANKAFKAVSIPSGKSNVVFEFYYPQRLIRQITIAGFCIIFTIIVLSVIIRLLFKRPDSEKHFTT